MAFANQFMPCVSIFAGEHQFLGTVMAKRKSTSERPSGEMTVMVFQLKGDDETLQQGLRTIENAVSRVVPSAPALAQPPLVHRVAPALPGMEDVLEDDDSVIEADYSEANDSSGTTRKRTIKSPKVIDVDLESGEVSLATFLAKCPEQVGMRYLFISYWFKKYRDTPAVSQDHVHTGFRHMGWHTPKNAMQPFRTLKSQHDWFHKGEEKSTYAINHVGENEVHKVMNKESDET